MSTASELVQLFNALPQAKTTNYHRPGLGLIGPDWHFDVRYMHLEPPFHIVLIVNQSSGCMTFKPIPSDPEFNKSEGFVYFPESSKDAAPEVAVALLRAFVHGFNPKMPDRPTVFAPRKLTTEFQGLAAAISAEFQQLGVRSEALCNIGISNTSLKEHAQTIYSGFFTVTKNQVFANFEDRSVAGKILPPIPIDFDSPDGRPTSEPTVEEQNETELTSMAGDLLNPCLPFQLDNDIVGSLSRGWSLLQKFEFEAPPDVIRREADTGDAEASLLYGLRRMVGWGCEKNRTLARKYLVKAAASGSAPDEVKCIAHGLLVTWHFPAVTGELVRSRYLYAACHHANVAASLARRILPPGAEAPLVILRLMAYITPQVHKVPELEIFYGEAWLALEDKNEQVESKIKKVTRKRLSDPNRYRCASVDCGIEATRGKLLAKCAGKCDPDKKPSYCSKECQRADWKNHKPFCKPGAPCSVLDPRVNPIGAASEPASLQIPIRRDHGGTFYVSSPSLTAEELKMYRDYILEHPESCAPTAVLYNN